MSPNLTHAAGKPNAIGLQSGAMPTMPLVDAGFPPWIFPSGLFAENKIYLYSS
jgi:hypothetical protein